MHKWPWIDSYLLLNASVDCFVGVEIAYQLHLCSNGPVAHFTLLKPLWACLSCCCPRGVWKCSVSSPRVQILSVWLTAAALQQFVPNLCRSLELSHAVKCWTILTSSNRGWFFRHLDLFLWAMYINVTNYVVSSRKSLFSFLEMRSLFNWF